MDAQGTVAVMTKFRAVAFDSLHGSRLKTLSGSLNQMMCRTGLTDRVEAATAAASKAGLSAGVYRILEKN